MRDVISSHLERVIEVGAIGPTAAYVAVNAICRAVYDPGFEKGKGLRCGILPDWSPPDTVSQFVNRISAGEFHFGIVPSDFAFDPSTVKQLRVVFFIGTGIEDRKFKAVLFANADVPRKIVYQVTRAVFDDLEDFRTQHPSFATLDRHTMVIEEWMRVPLHPGAEKYYSEMGWIR